MYFLEFISCIYLNIKCLLEKYFSDVYKFSKKQKALTINSKLLNFLSKIY